MNDLFEFFEYVPDGYGRIIDESNTLAYEGEWEDGLFNGFGKEVYSDGDVGIGECAGYMSLDELAKYTELHFGCLDS